MTEPELPLFFTSNIEGPQPVQVPEVLREHLAKLATDEFHENNELAHRRSQATYHVISKKMTPMTPEGVNSFGHMITAEAAIANVNNSETIQVRAADHAGILALKWLGAKSSAHGDEQTRDSVMHVLLHDRGIRGKRAAFSLWFHKRI